MQRARTGREGLGLALVSAAAFGSSGSFARSLMDAGWSPSAVVAIRVGTAALLLAVPAIWSLRGRWGALRRDLGFVVGYGVAVVAAPQLFFFNAVQHLSVGVALLLEYLGTVLVVGWLWVRHGARPRRLTVAGSAVAVLGLVLMLDVFGGSSLDPVGVLWGLAAAVGLACYFLLSAKADSELPPVVLAATGMAAGTLALLGLGAIGVLPLHAATRPVHLLGHETGWLVPVLGLSLIAAAVAYVAGIGAARLLGAKIASFVGLTETMFAILFAWALLGQLPTAVQLAGGALIVAGVALVRLDEVRTPARASTQATAGSTEPAYLRADVDPAA